MEKLTHQKPIAMLTTLSLLLLALLTITPPCVSLCDNYPSNISFPNFFSNPCAAGGSLLCMGSVNTTNGTLTLTTADLENVNQIGRVLYRSPVLAWPASICTTFTIRIVVRVPNTTRFGDGMTFVMAQDKSPSPSTSYGSFMGLFDQTNQRSIRQLAVEFDTFKNEFDPDANHIAIDTNSIEHSVAYQSLNGTGISLTSGRDITVRIEYDGWTKNMQVYVAYAGQPLKSLFNHTIKMKGTVPSSVYVGFTAATGTLIETHQVLSWNFTSIELPKISLGKEKNITVLTVVPILAGLVLMGLLSIPFVRMYQRKKRERLARKQEIEAGQAHM